MITTTLNQIQLIPEYKNKQENFQKLLASLSKTEPDDDLLSFEGIYEATNLNYALQCLNIMPDDTMLRTFACRCARSAFPVFENAFPGGNRPRKAIETVEAFNEHGATEGDMSDAWLSICHGTLEWGKKHDYWAEWAAASILSTLEETASLWRAATCAIMALGDSELIETEFLKFCRHEDVYQKFCPEGVTNNEKPGKP